MVELEFREFVLERLERVLLGGELLFESVDARVGVGGVQHVDDEVLIFRGCVVSVLAELDDGEGEHGQGGQHDGGLD